MRDGNDIDSECLNPPPSTGIPAEPAQDCRPTKLSAQQLAYWQKKLAGAPALLELPTDYPRPAIKSGRVASVGIAFGEKSGLAMRELGKSSGASLSSLILAAFSVLLSRYSGQADIVLGFVNADIACPLILRSELDIDTSFAGLVKQTQTSIDEARANGAVPLRQLAEALDYQECTSHSALVQALCVLEQPRNDKSGRPDLKSAIAPFDLTLRIQDLPDLPGEILYSTDLFKAGTIERMASHLTTLLDGALTDNTKPVFKLPILTAREYQQIVFEWNATTADFPDACAHELFELQVEKTPNELAVVFGDQSLSYAELNGKANQLAHYLITRGVGPDVLVGVCVRRSLDMVIALLGILKAGGAYVPLDPAYPADRLAYMIEDAKPTLLLSQESLLDQLQQRGANAFCLDRDWPLLSSHEQNNPAHRASGQTLAYVIYTSGSTGKPKGVALEHRGLTNLCITQAEAFQVDETSQVLQFASISFDAAVSETFVTLTKGACLHLIRQEALRSAYEITTLLEKSAINIVTLPPSLLAVLPKKPLPALKTLVLAGEAWSPELARTWAVGRRLLNAYGPTEGTVCATWFKVDASIEHTVPIGKPLANVNVYILDQHLQPTPVGVPGELYIGGAGLARGYLHRADLTEDRFIANPFCSDYSARMYRTGDKARYVEGGNIEFLGRIDNQVKLRGYRIELGEIEATLTTHDAVEDAAVIVREDHPGEKRLVAYIVGAAGLTSQLLKTHLKASLPDYMLPQNFVFIDAMPMSPNGKVDRKSLPSPSPVRS